MKQYMLLPEDSIELLRAQDEAEAAVCVFCERTMILFPCSKIEAVSIQRSVTEDRLHPVNCLELLARDTLFDAQQAVLIPVTSRTTRIFCRRWKRNAPRFWKISRQKRIRRRPATRREAICTSIHNRACRAAFLQTIAYSAGKEARYEKAQG